jgi:hypothetical protein
MNNRLLLIIPVLFCLSLTSHNPKVGAVLDVHNGVSIYYNGHYRNVSGRNITKDGYNLGLKWQCVEFIKRYYYEKYDFQFPDPYGHAREFFDKSLPDQAFNEDRGMLQFRNTRRHKPRVDDIVVYGASADNPFGHIGIVSKISGDKLEMVQQNMGTKTRQELTLAEYKGIYTIADFNVLGWLRLEQ